MMPFQSILPVALLMLAAAGCHNTWEGVKADTRHDLEKTGQKLDKAADKLDEHAKRDGG
jgi:predicted small secreted protein